MLNKHVGPYKASVTLPKLSIPNASLLSQYIIKTIRIYIVSSSFDAHNRNTSTLSAEGIVMQATEAGPANT